MPGGKAQPTSGDQEALSFSKRGKKEGSSAELIFPCACFIPEFSLPNPFPVLLPTNTPSQVPPALQQAESAPQQGASE